MGWLGMGLAAPVLLALGLRTLLRAFFLLRGRGRMLPCPCALFFSSFSYLYRLYYVVFDRLTVFPRHNDGQLRDTRAAISLHKMRPIFRQTKSG